MQTQNDQRHFFKDLCQMVLEQLQGVTRSRKIKQAIRQHDKEKKTAQKEIGKESWDDVKTYITKRGQLDGKYL